MLRAGVTKKEGTSYEKGGYELANTKEGNTKGGYVLFTCERAGGGGTMCGRPADRGRPVWARLAL